MSAIDTAKEIVRIAITSPVAKDVIELLKTKLSLLESQIATLEKENLALKDQNRNLQTENAKVKVQTAQIAGKGDELMPETVEVLKLFFTQATDISAESVAQHFQLS